MPLVPSSTPRSTTISRSNLPLGEQCHNALLAAANKKVAAMRARKLADRVFDRLFIGTEGRNKEEREAKARTEAAYIKIDDEALQAESDAIVAKAEADGLAVRFEEWRSEQANAREEMKLR